MRKLMWFAVGYVAGISAAMWLIPAEYFWHILFPLIAGALLLTLPIFVKRSYKLTFIIILGVVAGLSCFRAYEKIYVSPLQEYDGRTVELDIIVSDYGTVFESGSSAVGTVTISGTEYDVLFYLERQRELEPGDRVRSEFYLRFSNPIRRSVNSYQGEGVFLTAYSQADVYIRKGSETGFSYFSAKLRHGIKNTVLDIFPEDTQGLAVALLLGDSSFLSSADDNHLQDSGIRHIIAVSGLHISILCSFVYQLVWRKRWLVALIGIPLLILFASLVGFTPSVVRACFMQVILMLSMLLDKEYDPPTALAFAVIVILGIDPLAISSVGFQLSVSSVVGISLFTSKIQKYVTSRSWLGSFSGKSWKGKIKRGISRTVSTSLGAMALTVPLSAYYFGSVCTVGVITNIFALWVITYVFCGILLCLSLSLFSLSIGTCMAAAVSILIRYVLLVARWISKLPYATISAQNIYVLIWLLITYILFLIFLFAKKRAPRLLCGCITTLLCVSLTFSWMEGHQNEFKMTVLDVGQGQCIILQSDDRCYVVDCGGSSGEGAGDLAAHTLRTQGIQSVDGLILTHYDTDHAGGAESLMGQISVKHIYCPDIDEQDPIRERLSQLYLDQIQWVSRKQYISFENTIITLIPGDPTVSGNNGSMSILYQADKCDILITGDLQVKGEEYLMKSIRLPEVEILVAGHHGAASSTSLQLLHQVQPQAVVVSVGKNNSYSHPASQMLHRLKLFGCRVWRTDQNGTIIFKG